MLSEKGEELFYKYQYLIEIYTNKLARYNNEKEDLYQQGAIGLIEAIKRFDPEKGKFISYASKYISGYMKQHYNMTNIIGVNKNNLSTRKQVVNMDNLEEIYFSQEIEENYIMVEEKEILYKSIEKLDNRKKLILKMILDGKKVEEIALTLNCSRQAVYKTYNQAIYELRGLMS